MVNTGRFSANFRYRRRRKSDLSRFLEISWTIILKTVTMDTENKLFIQNAVCLVQRFVSGCTATVRTLGGNYETHLSRRRLRIQSQSAEDQ